MLVDQHQSPILVAVQNKQVRSEGDIYCAKNCGRGCTVAEYQMAVQAAKNLQERLGADWKVTVWDNLGWTYGATNGAASISPPSKHPKSQWRCIINVPNLSGICASGETPEEAAQNAARRVTESIHEMLGSFGKSLSPLIGHQNEPKD
jgi:hypothetical protein